MSSEGSLPLGGGVKRVDVVALRKKIAVGLGQEKVRKYWDILIRFTQFKLSKEELDTHARQVLGADYIPLHNELIHGIFQNALVSTINPPTVETPAVPLDMGEPLAERPAKKPKKKVGPGGQVLVSGGGSSSGGKVGGANRREPQDRLTHDQIWLNAQEMHRTQWRICDGADLYDESLALPSLINLRHQMRQRSQEHALSVAPDAVETLHRTLLFYVKNIIAVCTQVAQIRRGTKEPPPPYPVGPGGAPVAPAAHLLTPTILPDDLLVAFALHPELLGQERALNNERICLLHHH